MFFQAEEGMRVAKGSRGLGDAQTRGGPRRMGSCPHGVAGLWSRPVTGTYLFPPPTLRWSGSFSTRSRSFPDPPPPRCAGRGVLNETPPNLVLSLIPISEPTSLLSNSYPVFCFKKKPPNKTTPHHTTNHTNNTTQ